jgi:beta-phosphoglucomutase-like phosphatase (HAD superfamily)
MVDAVLLEWDGVLADTGSARRDALLCALADEGVDWSATAYDATCEGLDATASARVAIEQTRGSDPALADLVALRAGRTFTERLSRGFTLRVGVTEFLAACEARTRLAIVTRASRAETDLFLRVSGLDGAMACVFTADDVLQPPPAPELFEHAQAHLARTRRSRREQIVALVGTTPSIRAARDAGLHVLAVGAPAHVAIESDGALSDLSALTLDALATLAGITPTERRP